METSRFITLLIVLGMKLADVSSQDNNHQNARKNESVQIESEPFISEEMLNRFHHPGNHFPLTVTNDVTDGKLESDFQKSRKQIGEKVLNLGLYAVIPHKVRQLKKHDLTLTKPNKFRNYSHSIVPVSVNESSIPITPQLARTFLGHSASALQKQHEIHKREAKMPEITAPQRRHKPDRNWVKYFDTSSENNENNDEKTEDDNNMNRLRKYLTKLVDGKEPSSSIEDIMKIDDVVILNFPQTTVRDFFSQSGQKNRASPNNHYNNSQLDNGLLQNYPSYAPFVQDEPSTGNIRAVRRQPSTQDRNRRTHQLDSAEMDKVREFLKQYSDNRKRAEDPDKPNRFSILSSEEYDRNPYPSWPQFERKREHAKYDDSTEAFNTTTNKYFDMLSPRSPHHQPQKKKDFRSTKHNMENDSPEFLIYVEDDSKSHSDANKMSPSSEDVVREFYKHFSSLQSNQFSKEDRSVHSASVTSKSFVQPPNDKTQWNNQRPSAMHATFTGTGKYPPGMHPTFTGTGKSPPGMHPTFTGTGKSSPGTHQTYTGTGKASPGDTIQKTKANNKRSRKILHLTSHISLIIEDGYANLEYSSGETQPAKPHHPEGKNYLGNSKAHHEDKEHSVYKIPIPLETTNKNNAAFRDNTGRWYVFKASRTGQDYTRQSKNIELVKTNDIRYRQHPGLRSHRNTPDNEDGIWIFAEGSPLYPSKTNDHFQSKDSAEVHHPRSFPSTYDNQKPNDIIRKKSGDVSIEVQFSTDPYQRTYKKDAPPRSSFSTRSHLDSRERSSSFTARFKPAGKDYSTTYDKKYRYSSQEDNNRGSKKGRVTQVDDVSGVFKHGFNTLKFYWDLFKNGWPIILENIL